ncbi:MULTISPECIES: SH3 domain-containing protein [unclassified Sphingomonas]|uniref:SH3 domain-containing protein n=1 Tax=unclassified Sphingomonas TaxID=196159 RepID=UPI000448288D|nr:MULTISPECIES: SH3 domain-containing protein [unclassified Sphingomonas]EZP57009.1 hypothetical protein BW41_00502 [Sphingomonas sp. RIT328]
MAKATPGRSSQPSRKAFALTGPSVTLDPRTHAVRGDLADVRLAERVFAPHYAAPIAAVATAAGTIFADRGLSDPLGALDAGEPFEVLELAGRHAWGRATTHGLVGYVDRALLDRAAS